MAPPIHYWEAPEVQEIAERLIPLYHVHLLELQEGEIRYLWRSRAQRTGGKTVLAKAHLLSGMNAYLGQAGWVKVVTGSLFVLETARDTWETLTPAQREALVDHELLHFRLGVDEKGEIVKEIRPHDVEAFDAEVARHGAWKPDLARFAHALEAGADAAPPASNAELYPGDDEIGRVLASAREQEAGVADILRRARGR